MQGQACAIQLNSVQSLWVKLPRFRSFRRTGNSPAIRRQNFVRLAMPCQQDWERSREKLSTICLSGSHQRRNLRVISDTESSIYAHTCALELFGKLERFSQVISLIMTTKATARRQTRNSLCGLQEPNR